MLTDEAERNVARGQLERILASPGFARNERLSRFLRFVVEGHLEGKDRELKESLLAIEVFGRSPGYDPKQDPIVRTEASRLRARLSEYYLGEGKDDPLIIELPKGGYVPVIRPYQRRPETTAPLMTAHSESPLRKWRLGNRVWIGAGLTCLVVAVAAVGWSRSESSSFALKGKPQKARDAGRQLEADYLVEGSVLRSGRQLRVNVQLVRV